jgi:hypothetical protein
MIRRLTEDAQFIASATFRGNVTMHVASWGKPSCQSSRMRWSASCSRWMSPRFVGIAIVTKGEAMTSELQGDQPSWRPPNSMRQWTWLPNPTTPGDPWRCCMWRSSSRSNSRDMSQLR